jgi:hypothetical protein
MPEKESQEKFTAEDVRNLLERLPKSGVRIIGRDGPMWFENSEQVLTYLRSQVEKEERTRAFNDEWISQWYQ